jgi:phosphohistidine swiveling domain-containing protein
MADNENKEQEYTFLWSNTQYNITFETNLIGFRDYRENIWNQSDKILLVSRNNRITTYHSTADLKKDVERGKQFLDSKYVKKFFNDAKNVCKNYQAFFKKLDSTDYKKCTNEELFNLTLGAVDNWINAITYFRASQQEGTTAIIEALKSEFDDKAISTLLLPVEIDEANKEHMDWEGIVKKPFDSKAALKHAKKYPWLVPHQDSYDDIIESLKQRFEIKDHVSKDVKKEKEELKKKQEEILKKSKQKSVVKALQDLAVLRMKLKSYWAGNDFYTIPLCKEISERFGEDIKDLRQLYMIEDYRNLLLLGKKVSSAEKKKRREIMSGLYKDGQIIILSGKKAEDLAKKELGELYLVKDKDELKGVAANPGIVKGIARILESNNPLKTKEFRQSFKKGEILITQMTQPAIVDIASKASAIVTDEGGMLSHAAIISREFKIPCIVGTHFASVTFKDGEMIEVDADKGIVRRIK